MPYIIQNNAEMGSNAVDVTTGNSGDTTNTAWSAVTTGSGSTVKFSNTVVADGSLSYQFSSGASIAPTLEWSLLTINGNGWPIAHLSFKVYFVSTVPASSPIVTLSNTVSAINGSVSIDATGKLRINNTTGTAIATSTNTLPANQWVRIEAKLIVGVAIGYVEARLYLNANSATPTETISGTSNTTNTNIDLLDFGIAANNGQVAYFDNIQVRRESYPDPPYTMSSSWMRF